MPAVNSTHSGTRDLLRPASEFARDFGRYAGRRGLVSALLVGLGAVLDSVSLVMLVPILSVVLGSGPAAGTGAFGRAVLGILGLMGAATRFERLAILMGLFVALMLVRGIVQMLRDVHLARLQIEFVERKRVNIMRLLMAARWDMVVTLRHARLSHLMSSDVQNLATTTAVLMQCAVAAATLASQLVLAFFLSPLIALIALALLLVSAQALRRIANRARGLGHFVTNANLSLLNITTQFLGGVKLAKSQNLQGAFMTEFKDSLQRISERQVAFTRVRSQNSLLLAGLISLIVAAATLIGFGALDIAPPILFAMLFLLSRVTGPLSLINQGVQQFAMTLPAYEKIRGLERELESAAAAPPGTAAPLPDGPLLVRDVSFSYPVRHGEERRPVLRHLNFRLDAGRLVGIAGASGAGKTSFVDLLLGLFPPDSGEIAIGNVPLAGDLLPTWRDRLSYVAQDPFLFHDTIRRNLAWAAPRANEQEMQAALALTGADQFVARLTEGLDTIVGERGVLMSGGERQRLALSRAILRRPRLLILDEATNALDIASEQVVLERLVRLSPRPAIVMIAHRPESLTFCDEVLILENGAFGGALSHSDCLTR